MVLPLGGLAPRKSLKMWRDPSLCPREQNLATPRTPTRAAGSPQPGCGCSPAAEPTNYLLMKSCCSWAGPATPGAPAAPLPPAAPPRLGALEELVRLWQVGESFVSSLSWGVR